MPQPRRDAVHRFFVYDPSNNTSKCNLCGNAIKGKHTTNLKSHISSKHVQEYLFITNINKENHQHQPSTSRHSTTTDQVMNSCVKLVTVHGRPLALIQDKAFQEIINIAVPSNIQTKHINIKVIKGMIPEKAYQIKLKIASEIRNNLISLKLDSASYLDKKFLGINLQYIKEGQIKVRNLAVLEVLERQTGDFLKEKVLEVLNDFMISTAQIYSITTDNGRNFKRMTRLLTDHCSTITEDINTDMNSDYEIDDENDGDEDYDDVELGTDTPLELNFDTFINVMRNESFKPRIMLCAAHTLQLAVKDAIAGNLQVQLCIELARKAVKILRRPTIKNFIKSKKLNKPIIDCPTRWSSTYQMLVRLVSLKDICNSQSELTDIFSGDFWTQITEVLTCLKPINEATEALQREQLTIGDFYITWLNCKAKLESIASIFANELVTNMTLRERTLLNTDLVLENLYLDGRLNVLLSDQDCLKAQKLLSETYRQLQSLTSRDAETRDVICTTVCTSRHDSENSSHVNDVLEKRLKEAEALRGLPGRTSLDSFEGMLQKLRYEPRVPLDNNIVAHWSSKDVPKTKNPTLLNVANCVLAAPATQVSVERLFSSVKFILNPLRSNISSSLLQDIMLIRSNHDLFA